MSKSIKYLYFPLNKCASTTFKKIFKDYNHILIPNLNLDKDPDKNLHLLEPNFKKYFKLLSLIQETPITTESRFKVNTFLYVLMKLLKENNSQSFLFFS